MNKKKQRGFTLLEVLVVVAIIGVLTTVSAFTFSGYVEDSESMMTRQELSQIVMMVEVAKQQNKTYELAPDDVFTVVNYTDLEDQVNIIAMYNADSGLVYQTSYNLLLTPDSDDENVYYLSYTNHDVTLYYSSDTGEYSTTQPY